MASIDVAKLLNKITQDIPGINTVLKALANWDVSALSDVPDGAMQATTDANNNLTIKKKVSGSYTPVAKLMHDVDKLDGYHASASATANAVAVRNAQGALPGNILGNSATADTATALATGSVVPVNQGGTGATTASQARANLGVADGADFTTHIAKQASSSVEGHVKLDALAANGSNTAAPGGFGLGMPLAAQIPANTDLDTVVLPGFYSCRLGTTVATLLNCPTNKAFSFLVEVASGYGPVQTLTTYNNGARFQRTKVSGVAFSEWRSLPNGISDSTATTSSTVAASATAVKAVSDVATAANLAAGAAQTTADSAATAADHAQTKSGTSSTASGTAAKVVTCSGFELSDQARIFVTFSNANTVAAAITLNVNGTGAKSVYNQTGIISTTNTALFAANQPIEFRYDGVGWVFYDAEKLVAPLVAGKANVDLANATGNAINFYLHARDVKTTGTKGGAATGGAWNTRDLNTVVVNRIAGASLASNRITLPPGKYYLHAMAPCAYVNRARIAIYNYTTSSYALYGMLGYGASAYNGTASLLLDGELDVSATTTIELRMWAESTHTTGCGIESNITGVSESYSEVQIWKM